MAILRANDIEIDYETYGPPSGRPLVLVRGLGTQRIAWPDAFLDALGARDFRVIAFDNRDVGGSTKFDSAGVPDVPAAMANAARGEAIDSAYTVDHMAADIVGLLDGLEIDTAHVFGISMGGMIVQVLAARSPGRLRSATSVMSSSGATGLPGPRPDAAQALMSSPEDPTSRESVVSHTARTSRVFSSPGFPVSDEYLRGQAERAYDRCYCPGGVARQLVSVLASGSRAELLAKIDLPFLVIHGVDDPLVPVECGRDTARRVPGAELVEVPGMAHDVVPGNAPILVEALDAHARRAEERRR